MAEHDADQLTKLLKTAVLDGQPLRFDRLRQKFVPSVFTPPQGRTKAAPLPRWKEYEPEAPRGGEPYGDFFEAVSTPTSRMRGRIDSMSEPTGKYSITMPRDIAEAAKARSGPSGLSAYVAAAVARQIERDNVNELIQVAEAEHGPVTDEEIQALRDQLHRARQEQTQDGANAA